MTSLHLILAPRAKADLAEIHAYSLASWGSVKADAYLDQMEAAFLKLLDHPRMGKLRPEVLPGIRSLTVEKHVLFYRLTERAIEVLGVVHQRMDIGSSFP